MTEFIGLLFSTVLINNLALTYLIGLDLHIAVGTRIEAAWLVGLTILYCLALCMPGVYLIDLVLILLQLQYLNLLFYVLLILIVVFGLQRLSYLLFPLSYRQIDAVMPIILMNSVLLAVILLRNHHLTPFFGKTFWSAIGLGLGTGASFLLLLLVITCLHERISNHAIPQPFKGLPILLISLGIFSMGLMGLVKWQ